MQSHTVSFLMEFFEQAMENRMLDVSVEQQFAIHPKYQNYNIKCQASSTYDRMLSEKRLCKLHIRILEHII